MKEPVDRRKFFIAGTSVGVGALFHVAPLLGHHFCGAQHANMKLTIIVE